MKSLSQTGGRPSFLGRDADAYFAQKMCGIQLQDIEPEHKPREVPKEMRQRSIGGFSERGRNDSRQTDFIWLFVGGNEEWMKVMRDARKSEENNREKHGEVVPS